MFIIEVNGALKHAQKDFNETYAERISDLAEKERIVTASHIQKKMKLGPLIQYIDMMVSVEEASFDKLAKTLNELIEQMDKTIRARLKAEAQKHERRSGDRSYG